MIPPIDWSSIRPLNGGRDKGFEELCSQLARAEIPAGAFFERKGTPDAGVECYAVFRNASEWGWQAKYFDGLGNSQWSQINESVLVAIEKHPRLERYFVCTPLDRPDARIKGRKSAKDKWDDYVKKWTRVATEKGMTVEFVYWGSHELLERLARPEHVGRVRFWFDVHGFDTVWFTARLDEALRTAGPRYTPEVHVDLPIASELEAFGRTDLFFERVKSQARAIRDKLRTLMFSEGTTDATLDAAAASVSTMGQVVLKSFAAIQSQPVGPLPFKGILDQVLSAEQITQELSKYLEERECEFDAKAESTEAKSSRSSNRHNPYRERRIRLFPLASELQSAREALIHAEEIAGNTIL
ncbi:MAG TPA: ATP-binding protein, partial [Bacillota bacterium]|nr:ATP-binding protein [Bacillota bacterium]